MKTKLKPILFLAIFLFVNVHFCQSKNINSNSNVSFSSQDTIPPIQENLVTKVKDGNMIFNIFKEVSSELTLKDTIYSYDPLLKKSYAWYIGRTPAPKTDKGNLIANFTSYVPKTDKEQLNLVYTKERKEGTIYNYADAEKKPFFGSFEDFINEQIRFPQELTENKISGHVTYSMVVNERGDIENPQIINDIGFGSGEAVLKVLYSFNLIKQKLNLNWIAGKVDWKPVKVYIEDTYFIPTIDPIDYFYHSWMSNEDRDLLISPEIRYGHSEKVIDPLFPNCTLNNLKTNPDSVLSESTKLIADFVFQNIKYPADAKAKNIKGICNVQVVIDSLGRMNDLKLTEDIGYGCGEEALRLVNLMKNISKPWRPFRLNEKTLTVKVNIPIYFPPLDAKGVYGKKPPPPRVEPKVDVDEVSHVAEQMPRFPGCEDETDRTERMKCSQEKMLQFVYGHLKYPPIARYDGVEGTVVLRFYVDKDGSIKDIQILKDIGSGCGEEAERVVELMNEMPERWIPGMQGGKKVKVYFNLPLRFRL